MNKQSASLTILLAIIAAAVLFGSRFFVSVPAGHVAVATLFGEVQDKPYQEGLTIPVNPLFNFIFLLASRQLEYCRKKELAITLQNPRKIL